MRKIKVKRVVKTEAPKVKVKVEKPKIEKQPKASEFTCALSSNCANGHLLKSSQRCINFRRGGAKGCGNYLKGLPPGVRR